MQFKVFKTMKNYQDRIIYYILKYKLMMYEKKKNT